MVMTKLSSVVVSAAAEEDGRHIEGPIKKALHRKLLERLIIDQRGANEELRFSETRPPTGVRSTSSTRGGALQRPGLLHGDSGWVLRPRRLPARRDNRRLAVEHGY